MVLLVQMSGEWLANKYPNLNPPGSYSAIAETVALFKSGVQVSVEKVKYLPILPSRELSPGDKFIFSHVGTRPGECGQTEYELSGLTDESSSWIRSSDVSRVIIVSRSRLGCILWCDALLPLDVSTCAVWRNSVSPALAIGGTTYKAGESADVDDFWLCTLIAQEPTVMNTYGFFTKTFARCDLRLCLTFACKLTRFPTDHRNTWKLLGALVLFNSLLVLENAMIRKNA